MTASDITRRRCFNHPLREAAARCPSCRRFFCRECVTEHDDRVLCVTCLNRTAGTGGGLRKRLPKFFPVLQFLSGIFIAWMLFYGAGQLLISIPADYHEGTVWEKIWPVQP
jgi:hypothetical protein